MARKLVNEQEVFEVADRIASSGQAPTITKVYGELGRGSYTTIRKYLRAWEEARDGDTPTDPEAPEKLLDSAAAFGREVWLMALKQARTEVADERVELEAQKEALAQEMEKMAADADRAIERAEDLTAQLAALQQRFDAIVADHQSLEVELAARNSALEEAHEMISRLERRLDSLSIRHEEKLEEVAQLTAQLNQLQAEQHQLNVARMAERIAQLEEMMEKSRR
jgi:flagellin-like hook-associated protein FlgL